MKRLLAVLTLLALASVPVLAQTAPKGWTIQAAVNGGFVSQTVTDTAGKTHDEFTPTALTGIQFWRNKSIFGFSAGIAGLPDAQETLPRVAPYVALHLGTPDAQIFVGATYDPQSLNSEVRPTFGFTMALGQGK